PAHPADEPRVRLFVEYGYGTDRRAGAAAPFEGQPDEPELALTDQRLQIAQALDVRDVELKTGLVDQRVDDPHRARPHGIDAEMDYSLPRQPLGRSDVHPRIVGRVGRPWKGPLVMARAQEHRAALGNGCAGLCRGRFQIGRRDLGLGW